MNQFPNPFLVGFFIHSFPNQIVWNLGFLKFVSLWFQNYFFYNFRIFSSELNLNLKWPVGQSYALHHEFQFWPILLGTITCSFICHFSWFLLFWKATSTVKLVVFLVSPYLPPLWPVTSNLNQCTELLWFWVLLDSSFVIVIASL